jgi:ornithine carbamoyltransferase
MNSSLKKHLLEQLNSIIESYTVLKSKSQYDDLSDSGYEVAHQLITRSKAAIERISGKDSAYSRQIEAILARPREHDYNKLIMIAGVVESLHADLQAGYLSSVSELIHGELFADFLEMSEHLLNEGYKDAAAVISGSALESHLRQLCIKHSIDVEVITPKGVQPKKADQMNADLARATVYSKLDQKNVTAWLDLRNKAAHGHYTEYSKEQVALLNSGVRDFLTRNPA